MDDKNKFVTYYRCLVGWKAVVVWWNPDMGGFWEPWQTARVAHPTREGAEADAREWADAEGLRYEDPAAGTDLEGE